MVSTRILGLLLLLAALVLPAPALAMEFKPGQGYTFEGLIDTLSRTDHRIALKSTSPTVKKSADVTVDDHTLITINKKPATFADLEVGDKIWVRFVDGVASKIAVTRDGVPAPADK